MMEKYKNLQKTSNSSSALHHDMVQRVLPSVAEFINKRFEFLPQKRDSLIDTLNSFKKVLLERGGMYTVAREDDNDEYNVGDDNDEPVQYVFEKAEQEDDPTEPPATQAQSEFGEPEPKTTKQTRKVKEEEKHFMPKEIASKGKSASPS